jgi:uncharacterized RDD family membrane protein YckC
MTAQDFAPAVPSTPDGVPLAGWWQRAVAWLFDWVIVAVGSLPISGYFWYRYLEDDDPATTSSWSEPWAEYRWSLAGFAIYLVANFAYQYFFLVRTGATPGKKAIGISVRLRDVAGPPPGPAVVKRVGLIGLFEALGFLPGSVGLAVGSVGLLDVLWPLWDGKRQAWHDKYAATNVVRGPQPR